MWAPSAVVVIVATALLEGVLVGLAAGILLAALRMSQTVIRHHAEEDTAKVVMAGNATFLRLPKVIEALESAAVSGKPRIRLDLTGVTHLGPRLPQPGRGVHRAAARQRAAGGTADAGSGPSGDGPAPGPRGAAPAARPRRRVVLPRPPAPAGGVCGPPAAQGLRPANHPAGRRQAPRWVRPPSPRTPSPAPPRRPGTAPTPGRSAASAAARRRRDAPGRCRSGPGRGPRRR